jgi:signal transduction histidine kinase
MLTAFMDQAAVALENARLFQSEKEQRELAEALEEAATVVNSSLELDQVLDRILEQIERVVVGDTFNVMLIEDHVARIVRSRGYHQLGMEQQAQELVLRVEDYVNLRAIRSGETYLVLDTHNDPDWELLPGWEQIHSYLGVPIHIKGETAGILSVEGTQVAQFNAHDAHRLEAFASHAATAVENAQLFQQLRHYADDLEALVQARTVELQAQYAWLDAVLRSVSDGIIVVDTLGKILQMNSVAETWLNQTLTLEDAKRLRSAVKVLATRAFERPAKTLTLTGLDLHLHAAPISEPGMEQVAVVAVHDISHLKALNRMKSQFVSNVSHELRTPVTTIKLYANLLQHCAPEKRPGYLDALSKEADRQAVLVEDILQISRIDAGKLELKPKLISLSQLIEDVIMHHKLLAKAQGLKLEHRILGMIPKMVVDPERVMQVLNNLVENAIRYTPAGGSVVISTDRVTMEDRAWVLVHVADTGIGIPEEELPYVFDRFFRGVGPRQMQKPGTGLGLTIVKEIVELHGGRVAVESHVGEGSTFTVWLPLALPSSDDI